MPRSANQRQHGLRGEKAIAALMAMPPTDPIEVLIWKAVNAKEPWQAEAFARAALTVAQAISQQQFNQPKRKAKRNG